MPRNNKYVLKTNGIGFTSKEKVSEHFRMIIQQASGEEQILDQNHINDVIDFIQDIHNDSELIQSEFDLENCIFFVKKSKDFRTECIWIKNDKGQERQIATSKNSFGNPPTARQNFLSWAKKLIQDFKLEKRKEYAKIQGIDPYANDLWHKDLLLIDIVDEFIAMKGLSKKLEEIISPNGSVIGCPQLISHFELADEFLDFYIRKKGNQFDGYSLKPRKLI